MSLVCSLRARRTDRLRSCGRHLVRGDFLGCDEAERGLGQTVVDELNLEAYFPSTKEIATNRLPRSNLDFCIAIYINVLIISCF